MLAILSYILDIFQGILINNRGAKGTETLENGHGKTCHAGMLRQCSARPTLSSLDF
jgi:hypothetical protein